MNRRASDLDVLVDRTCFFWPELTVHRQRGDLSAWLTSAGWASVRRTR